MVEYFVDVWGLNWLRVIVLYEVVVIFFFGVMEEVFEFFDKVVGIFSIINGIDVILDDCKEMFGWKMRDVDIIGYFVIVVLGKEWR